MNPKNPTARLGLGLAAIGRPAYITEGRERDLGSGAGRSVDVMRERAHRLLDEAWALGIRYVDAARSYGLAEQFLGSWLAGHPERRSQLTIGSKWGYEYVGGWQMDAETQERKIHSLQMFERQWPQTLEALGGAPDVYLVHSLTPDSPALADEPLLERLRELAASGVRVGFSTSGPGQGAVIRAALALPDAPFSAVQTTWNLLEPSAGPALAEAHDAGWLVVVKEALANGRLVGVPVAGLPMAGSPGSGSAGVTSLPGAGWPLAGSAGVAAVTRATGGADDRGAVALGIAVAQPWADIVLSGAVTPEQLRQNMQAAEAVQTAQTAPVDTVLEPAAGPGSSGVLPAELAALAEPPEQYWASRSARAWL